MLRPDALKMLYFINFINFINTESDRNPDTRPLSVKSCSVSRTESASL